MQSSSGSRQPLQLYKRGFSLGTVPWRGSGSPARHGPHQQPPGAPAHQHPGAFRWPPVAPPGPAGDVPVSGRADGHRGDLRLGCERLGHRGFHQVQEAAVALELHPGEPGRGRPAGDALRQLRQLLQQHQRLLCVRQAAVRAGGLHGVPDR